MNPTNTALMRAMNDCTDLQVVVHQHGSEADLQHLLAAMHTVVQDLARHNPTLAAAYQRLGNGPALPPFAEVDAAKHGVEVQHG